MTRLFEAEKVVYVRSLSCGNHLSWGVFVICLRMFRRIEWGVGETGTLVGQYSEVWAMGELSDIGLSGSSISLTHFSEIDFYFRCYWFCLWSWGTLHPHHLIVVIFSHWQKDVQCAHIFRSLWTDDTIDQFRDVLYGSGQYLGKRADPRSAYGFRDSVFIGSGNCNAFSLFFFFFHSNY